ncbi:MAG: tetratricopeptide repeat protein [Hormoscilla sp. GM7CHS1pb]|nr:tetratricopeptide repeat protein [Hormoscilla sp. GM7CHS1pb]
MEKGYEEAIGLYDRAIAQQPDLPEAWNNRGGAMAGATLRDWQSCNAIRRRSHPMIRL